MTRYVVRIIRTLVVEADSEGEATTMSLYATTYPEYLTGIEYADHDAKVLFNQDEAIKKFQDWPEGQGSQS